MSCAAMGQMLSTKGWSSEVSENVEKQSNKNMQHKSFFYFLCYQFLKTQWCRKTTFTNLQRVQNIHS